MSFEDHLRKYSQMIDYSDRDKLLRETAKRCVPDFKKGCEVQARVGRSSWTQAAGYNIGLDRSVIFVPDAGYEAARAEAARSLILCNDIYFKLSEAERFQALLRQELQDHDMGNTRVWLQEATLNYKKTGFFGSVRSVREPLGKYRVYMSLSW